MQFRVTVPPGLKGGQVVTVNAAGAQFNVRVPKEVKAGDSFLFTLTPEQVNNARKRKGDGGVIHENTLLEGTKATPPPLLFHDYTDLGMALCLGFVIGFAIVFGFVLGVLFVTEPLPNSFT